MIGNKSVFFKSWFEAGIHCIGDILKNGTFISLGELNRMYNLNINFIRYEGVTRAIDKFVKKYCLSCSTQQIIKPFLPSLFQLVLKNEPGAKRLYTILNKNNEQPPVKAKWCTKLNTIINEKEWQCLFELPFLITSDVKVQWFQYRLIHRILGTNSLLNKMKITDDPLCSFCKQSDENLEHLFCECQISKAGIDEMLPEQYFPFINMSYTCISVK